MTSSKPFYILSGFGIFNLHKSTERYIWTKFNFTKEDTAKEKLFQNVLFFSIIHPAVA